MTINIFDQATKQATITQKIMVASDTKIRDLISNELDCFLREHEGRSLELYIYFCQQLSVNICTLLLGEIMYKSKRPELNILGEFYEKLSTQLSAVFKEFTDDMKKNNI